MREVRRSAPLTNHAFMKHQNFVCIGEGTHAIGNIDQSYSLPFGRSPSSNPLKNLTFSLMVDGG